MVRVKHLLKEMIGFGLVQLFGRAGKDMRGVYSVYFHNPSPALFRGIVSWFSKNGFGFLSLEQFEQQYKAKTLSQGKYALITFDDGWVNNLKLVDIIEEYNVPVGIFIPTEPVISGNYWWEYTGIPQQEQYSGVANTAAFKQLGRETFFEKVDLLKARYSLTRSCITVDELTTLSTHNLVTIGSHTVTHPILIRSEQQAQQYELSVSKSQLESWIGKEVKYLAYPNGDYNSITTTLAAESGYALCFSTEPLQITGNQDIKPYAIPRFSVNDHGGYYENLAKALGIWQRFFFRK